MLKKIGLVVLVLTIFGLILWFTKINPGSLELDLAFAKVEASIPLAISATFVIGWLFGLACTGIFIIRLINERRQLRKSLRVAESEVTSLRNLPIADAD
ncbi:MAG: LapA family protein [Gammaproteobacteria bacterium]|nr:LapA family protein [Gammaproteobacteria bacterium]